MRIAWGLTGSGDKFRETYEVMAEYAKTHEDVRIDLYLSKAAEQVAKYYKLHDELKEGFDAYFVEKDPNTPFISAMLQTGKYDILIVAPVTSNTVAKVAVGISDTLITNAVIQGIKGFVPVAMMPVDYHEGEVTTELPNGKLLRLKVRKEDAENVKNIEEMDEIRVFEEPYSIPEIIKELVPS